MSVPEEYVVCVVGYKRFIYEVTQIICCMGWGGCL